MQVRNRPTASLLGDGLGVVIEATDHREGIRQDQRRYTHVRERVGPYHQGRLRKLPFYG